MGETEGRGGGGDGWTRPSPTNIWTGSHPYKEEMEWSDSVCCHRNACCQGSSMCVKGKIQCMDMHICRWSGLHLSCPSKQIKDTK